MKVTKNYIKRLIQEELEQIKEMSEAPVEPNGEPNQNQLDSSGEYFVMYREHYNEPYVIGEENGYTSLEAAVAFAEEFASQKGLKKQDTSDPRTTAMHIWWGTKMFGKVQEYRTVSIVKKV